MIYAVKKGGPGRSMRSAVMNEEVKAMNVKERLHAEKLVIISRGIPEEALLRSAAGGGGVLPGEHV